MLLDLPIKITSLVPVAPSVRIHYLYTDNRAKNDNCEVLTKANNCSLCICTFPDK